jgi:prophage antirepressor-like protein/predicted GIY-YIG superfamily endonuclease
MEKILNEISKKFQIDIQDKCYNLNDIAKNIIKSTSVSEYARGSYPHATKINGKRYIIAEEFKTIIKNGKSKEAAECRKLFLVNNNLNKIFAFEGKEISWIVHINTIWTKAVEIAKILEYEHLDKGLNRYISDENKKPYDKILSSESLQNQDIIKFITGPISKETIFVNEAGLYELIFNSGSDISKRFNKWVTTEVLPSATRTGKYDGTTSNSEIIKQIKKIFIDYNDYIGKDVLYIIKIGNNLFKFGISSDLRKRLEQHTNTFKTIECIKVFVLSTEIDCREIETNIRRLTKQLNINKIFNNQTEIFETTDTYTIEFILNKIDTYIENQKINKKVNENPDNNLLMAQEMTRQQIVNLNSIILDMFKNQTITFDQYCIMTSKYDLNIVNKSENIKQEPIECIPKKKECNSISTKNNEFIEIDNKIDNKIVDNKIVDNKIVDNKIVDNKITLIKQHKSKCINTKQNDSIKKHKDKNCIDCNTLIEINSNRCIECSYKKKIKDSIDNGRPSYKTLKKDLEQLNFTQVGKLYSKSDNTIRKWLKVCEKYDLKDYEGKKIIINIQK